MSSVPRDASSLYPPEPAKTTVTTSETMKVVGFVIAILPILVPVNIILWRVATMPW